jgi:hypothetical protein
MARATGIPLALGRRRLLDGRVTDVGVHAPEAVCDPRPFVDALAAHCEPPVAGMDAMVLVGVGAG